MKKIFLLITLCFTLFGCDSIEFQKGVHHEKNTEHKYNKKTNEITIDNINGNIYVEFYHGLCGNYGLVGFIIPIIPSWDNFDCSSLKIRVSSADSVQVKIDDNVVEAEYYDLVYKKYTFPIPTKSLSKGATLIIEKDNKIYKIPFRYQHTFNFEIWGR